MRTMTDPGECTDPAILSLTRPLRLE